MILITQCELPQFRIMYLWRQLLDSTYIVIFMACARKRGNWKSEHLEMAMTEVQEGNISIRKALEKYRVPKSII